MAETTLTIRMDDALKERLQKGSDAEHRSVTEAITRLVELHLDRQCPTCGRSDEPGSLPAGLTGDFRSFLEKRQKEGRMTPITVTAVEATRVVSYNGRVDAQTITHGMLLLLIQHPENAMTEFRVAIPRGAITGWEEDYDGDLHARYVVQGYIDGNGRIQQGIAVARMGIPVNPRGGRGGRRG